jgi:hypothetical protein
VLTRVQNDLARANLILSLERIMRFSSNVG